MADEAKAAAEKKLAEDKKKIQSENEARQKFYADRAKTQGRPTPTQEEADLIRLGNHVELSPDGSPHDSQHIPSSYATANQTAASGGGYSHRQSTARTHTPSGSSS